MKGSKNFEWTPECSEAFKGLKEYLGIPPLLSSPRQGETLFVYLAAADLAVAAVLVREEDSILKPVYYVSKALTDVETRYFNAEKLGYALVIAARKLRAYFSAYSIIVYTDALLRKVLHKQECSGQLLNWSIELTKFDIDYQPRRTIQAQPLADFLVETTFSSEHNPSRPLRQSDIVEEPAVILLPDNCWTLYVDGSVSKREK